MTFTFRIKKETDPEVEKVRMIRTAAKLIRSDIKSIVQDKTFYPSSLDMSTAEVAMNFLPESLRILLEILFVGKEKDLKVCAQGQAIITWARNSNAFSFCL
jgi:hypothetical protein